MYSFEASRIRLFVPIAVTSVLLASCAVVDHFEPRALQYNEEAASTKSNTILLNVLRSSQRLPLQFTEYTSAVGQTFAQGQISASLPVGIVPKNGARTWMVNPQVQGTAQTQTTIQNLNTQEFYYGLTSPLTLKMIATFMAVGYDPATVLMLSVSSLKTTDGKAMFDIENDSDNWQKLNQFYFIVLLLNKAGLSFETTKAVDQGIGPPMAIGPATIFLQDYIKAAATASANASGTSLPDIKKVGSKYQLTKKTSDFRICFKRRDIESFHDENGSLVNYVRGLGYVLHMVYRQDGEPDTHYDMVVPPTRLCGYTQHPDKPAKDDPVFTNWELQLRSVQAVYSYLGGFVRAQINEPETFDNAYIFPRQHKKNFFLFRLSPGRLPGAAMTASLNGTYSLYPPSAEDDDHSTQVVSLLTDLWALQSSAKSFPANTTVSVTAN